MFIQTWKSCCVILCRVCGPDICQLPADQGPCQLYTKSFYYSVATGRCETFLWGGCQGNENRFATIDACEVRCRPARHSLPWQHDGNTNVIIILSGK